MCKKGMCAAFLQARCDHRVFGPQNGENGRKQFNQAAHRELEREPCLIHPREAKNSVFVFA